MYSLSIALHWERFFCSTENVLSPCIVHQSYTILGIMSKGSCHCQYRILMSITRNDRSNNTGAELASTSWPHPPWLMT
uniref:Uncharacterized protein n=1 Tax=Zea mays TaxID=4577 RepID=C0PFZ5_MAIZE|nr:unknown [Zea mays]